MPDWVLVNALFRPDQNLGKPEKGYWPVGRRAHSMQDAQPISFQALFYQVWRRRGLNDKQIAERYKQEYGGRRG